jgi:hypothetical protein
MDCCLQHDFFDKPTRGSDVPRGLEIMLSLDAWGSTDYAMTFTSWGLHQSGVLVQDARELPSARMDLQYGASSALLKAKADLPSQLGQTTHTKGMPSDGADVLGVIQRPRTPETNATSQHATPTLRNTSLEPAASVSEHLHVPTDTLLDTRELGNATFEPDPLIIRNATTATLEPPRTVAM